MRRYEKRTSHRGPNALPTVNTEVAQWMMALFNDERQRVFGSGPQRTVAQALRDDLMTTVAMVGTMQGPYVAYDRNTDYSPWYREMQEQAAAKKPDAGALALWFDMTTNPNNLRVWRDRINGVLHAFKIPLWVGLSEVAYEAGMNRYDLRRLVDAGAPLYTLMARTAGGMVFDKVDQHLMLDVPTDTALVFSRKDLLNMNRAWRSLKPGTETTALVLAKTLMVGIDDMFPHNAVSALRSTN